MEQKQFFTCIGRGYGAPCRSATREDWLKARREPWLATQCAKIERLEAEGANEDIIKGEKAKLWVWTPHCAAFNGNHRATADAAKPLQRLMLDFDEKRHTEDIVKGLKPIASPDGGEGEMSLGGLTVLLIEESVRRGTHVLVELPDGMDAATAQQLMHEATGFAPDKAVKEDTEFTLRYVDDNMLRTPPVAVSQVKREILRMADIALGNVDRSLEMATQLDFAAKPLFERDERELNFINRELIAFVVRLSGKSGLGEKDRAYLSGTYRSVRDVERIGDYAENIMEYALALAGSNQQFSEDAKHEISHLEDLLHQLFDHAMTAYREEDRASLDRANEIEEEIDDYTKLMEEGHIARMEKGICTPSVGAQYLELSSNAERIADHMINIAKSIKSL